MARHIGPLLVFLSEMGSCLSWNISLFIFSPKTAPCCSDPGIYLIFCSVLKVCVLSEVFEFCHFFIFFADLLVCLHCLLGLSCTLSFLCVFMYCLQSAAFNKTDHKILLNKLSYSFGISGTVFKWFISYLINRTQSVSLGDLNSSSLPWKYGVPQGFVLGSILFTLCSQPVSDKIREHNISYQKFADDTQLHKASQPTEFQSLVSYFESCFPSVKAWMLSNKLKLNDEKTEARP